MNSSLCRLCLFSFCRSFERFRRCRAGEKILHQIWVAFNVATIPHKHSSASHSSSGEQGRAHSWHLWESFALQKMGLAMQGPELGRHGRNHSARGRENPSASSAALKTMKHFGRTIGWCKSRSWEVRVSVARERGTAKSCSSATLSCHSLAKNLGRALRRGFTVTEAVRNFLAWTLNHGKLNYS